MRAYGGVDEADDPHAQLSITLPPTASAAPLVVATLALLNLTAGFPSESLSSHSPVSNPSVSQHPLPKIYKWTHIPVYSVVVEIHIHFCMIL